MLGRLLHSLKTNEHVVSLTLFSYRGGIGANSHHLLLDALAHVAPRLETLHLLGWDLGGSPKWFAEFATRLRAMQRLTHLLLPHCALHAESAPLLAPLLSSGSLRSFSLDHNFRLGNHGLAALLAHINAVRQNSLTNVSLADTGFSSSAVCSEIARLVDRSTAPHLMLDVRQNPLVGEEGARALYYALERNPSARLMLSSSQVTEPTKALFLSPSLKSRVFWKE